MPDRSAFQYTVLRVIPSIERGECINVGVVVFCPQRAFIGARIEVDESRLRVLAPGLDPAEVRPHLDAIAAVIAGERDGGPLAALMPSERFGWASAPSSTMIQPSETHTGLTDDPAVTLDRLFAALVPI